MTPICVLRGGSTGVLLIILCVIIKDSQVFASQSWYLGCYHSNGSSNSLMQPTLHSSPFIISQCARHCNIERADLSAVLNGSLCLCLSSHQLVQAPDSSCNLSCDSLPCGSESAASLYSSSGPYVLNMSVFHDTVVPAGHNVTFDASVVYAADVTIFAGYNNTSQTLFEWYVQGILISTEVVSASSLYAQAVFQHVFESPGDFSIELVVSNSISDLTFTTDVTVVLPRPLNLQLVLITPSHHLPSCIPVHLPETVRPVFVNESVVFEASLDIGDNLTYRWQISEDDSELTRWQHACNDTSCLAGYKEHVFTKLGVYKVAVNVSNNLGWLESNLTVAVMSNTITDLNVSLASPLVNQRSTMAYFMLSAETASRQDSFLVVDFKDGDVKSFSIINEEGRLLSGGERENDSLHLVASYGTGCTLHMQVDHEYTDEGSYLPSFHIFNNASDLHYHFKERLVVLQEIQGVSIVISSFVRRNMVYNITAFVGVPSINMTFDWSLQNGVSTHNETTWTPYLSYNFTFLGMHSIFVSVWNQYNGVTSQVLVEVQDPIEGLWMKTHSDRYLPTGSLVSFTCGIEQGTSVSYRWLVNQLVSTSAIYSEDKETANMTFSVVGLYNISVEARNSLGVVVRSLPFLVVIQDPIKNILVSTAVYTTLGHPVSIVVDTLHGSHVEFYLDYGHGRSNMTSVLDGQAWANHTFTATGLHKIDVYAENNVSGVSCEQYVIVQEPLTEVSVDVMTPAVASQPVQLAVMCAGAVCDREDLVFKWSSQCPLSALPFCLMTFSHAGSYNVNVTISNLVSERTAYLQVTVAQVSSGPRLTTDSYIQDIGQPVHFNIQNVQSSSDVGIDYGDGETELVSGLSQWMHRYSSKGIYTVKAGDMRVLIAVVERLATVQVIGPRLIPLYNPPLVSKWSAVTTSGSHIVYEWTYADGVTLISRSPHALLPVTKVGLHNITVSASNMLNQSTASLPVFAQHPIITATLTATPVVNGTASPLKFVVEGGAHFLLDVKSGDGEVETLTSDQLTLTTQRQSVSHTVVPMHTFTVDHTYPTIGQYDVMVNVSNRVSYMIVIAVASVDEPIAGIVLSTDTPIKKGAGRFTVTATVASGNDLSFSWNYATRIFKQETLGNMSRVTYNMYSAGDYMIEVSVSNPLYTRPATSSLLIQLVDPIKTLSLGTLNTQNRDHSALAYSIAGWKTSKVSFEAKVSGSHVTFTFDYGDQTSQVLKGERYLFWWRAVGTHIFRNVGAYLVKVTASNPFGNMTTIMPPFFVQKLPTGLRISSSNSPISTKLGNETVFKADVSYGTNLTYTWFFGDGSQPVNAGAVVSHTYSAIQEGGYTVRCKAFNKVGQASKEASVFILLDIQHVTISSNGSIHSTGVGVQFTAHHQPNVSGIVTKYHWYFGDVQVAKKNEMSVYTHFYTKADSYQVSVRAVNAISYAHSQPIHVWIIQPVSDVTLDIKGMLVNQSVNMSVYHYSGSNMMYTWNFGDGTPVIRTPTRGVRHVYTRIGAYTVQVTASNDISDNSVYKKVFILNQLCKINRIEILGERNQVVLYSSVIRVEAILEISCLITNVTISQWTIRNAGNNSLVSSVNPAIMDNQILYLPPKSLPYGNYSLLLEVKMNGTIVYATTNMFLSVEPSRVVSIIQGGIQRQVGRSDNITLNGSLSYDPDMPDTYGLKYNWSCWVLNSKESCFLANESNYMTSSVAISFPASSLKPVNEFVFNLTVICEERSALSTQVINVNSGTSVLGLSIDCPECFDDVINSNKRLILHAECDSCGQDVDYSWVIYQIPSDTDIALAGANDNLNCVEPDGSTWLKNFNTSVDHFNMNTTPRNSNSTVASTTQGVTEETSPSGLSHSGPGLAEGPVIRRRKRDTSGFPNIGEGGTGDGRGQGSGQSNTGTTTQPPPGGDDNVVDSSRPGAFNTHVLRESRIPYPIREEQTGTGLRNMSLVLKPGVLRQGMRYLIKATVQEKDGDQRSGEALVYFRVNASPIKGSCTIRPNEGVEDFTRFSAFCIAWQDDDKNLPMSYEVSYSTNDRLPNDLIYRGLHNDVGFTLPAANKSQISTVLVHLSILDNLGASTLVCSIPVRISRTQQNNNMSEQEVMYEEVFGQSSKLLAYEAQGDGRRVKTQVRLLATQMNHMDTVGIDLVIQQTMRQKLVETLDGFPIRDEYEVLQTASSLMWITAVPSELNERCLNASTSLLTSIGQEVLKLANVQQYVSEDLLTLVTEITSHLLTATANNRHLSPRVASGVVSQATMVIDSLLKAKLQYHLVGEVPVTRTADHISVFACRYKVDKVPHLELDGVDFQLPSTLSQVVSKHAALHSVAKYGSNAGTDDSYQVHLMSYNQNPYPSAPHQVETKVAALSLYSSIGDEIAVKNLSWSDPIHITLPRHTPQEMMTANFTLKKHKMNTHQFQVTAENMGQSLHIVINLQHFDKGRLFPVALLIRHEKPPTNHHYDIRHVYERDVNDIHLFVPANTFHELGTYYLGIVDEKFNAGRIREGEITWRDYALSVWWSQCVYWNHGKETWSGDGCYVQNTSTYHTMECACNHLTAFSGHIALVPVTAEYLLEHDVDTFFSLEENRVCISLVTVVTLLYTMLLGVCCWVDKKHKKTETVIYLHDNEPTDLFKYEITLETGFRKGAGTTAKVSVVLHGEEGMSETRELVSEIAGQRVFVRNSRDIFIMTLPESLGHIWKVQVWHNNEGSSPSWYLSRAVVQDCNAGRNYYFVCEKWFAVEEDDGKVEREIMALDESQLGFTQVFWSKGTQYLADYHLWTSLLTKPEYGTFLRSERLTVCYTLTMMYMCINALWYQMSEQVEYRGEFGLLDLSWYSVAVGVGCSLCVIPVGLILVLLFRKSNLKRHKPGVGVEEKYKSGKHNEETGSDSNSVVVQPIMTQSLIDQSIIHWQSLQEWAQKQWEKRYQKSMSSSESVKPDSQHEADQASSGFEDYMSQDQSHMISFSNQSSETKSDRSSCSQGKSVMYERGSRSTSRPQHCYLPFWFRYVAWTLCILISAGCGGVTILYGFWFGQTKSTMWIQSLYFSLLVCIFFSHPLMILLITLYTAIRYRNDPAVLNNKLPSYDSDDEREAQEKQAASRMIFFENCTELEKGVAARQRSRYLRFARPPQEKQLIKARKSTMKEKKLYSIMWDSAGFLLLLVLLTIMAFVKDSLSACCLNQSITSTFVERGSPSFSQLETIPDWWTWSRTTLMDSLYATNNHKDHLLPIPDSTSVMVGCANIRQVRVKRQPCNLGPQYNIADYCRYDYGHASKDTAQFGNFTYEERNTGESIMGMHGWYEGQGYKLELPRTRAAAVAQLLQLEKDGWIDRRTRAIIVEFTLFNAPTNLSTSVSLVYERPAVGRGFPYHRVKSLYLYRYINSADHFLLSCELLYILVIVIRLKNVCSKIFRLQKKFFCNPWNVLEVALISISLVYSFCFIYRFVLVEETVERVRATYHEKFVDISYLAFWDDLIKVFVGCMLFLTLLKSLQLLRYHKTFARFGNVMKRASKDLLVFMAAFFIWLMAYSSLGVGLFASISRNFRDVWSAITTVSAMLVHGYDLADIEEQRRVSSAMFLMSFTVFAFGMLLSYVVAILSYHYRDYKQEDILCMSSPDAVKFLWQKLKLWCRIDEPNEPEEDEGALPAEFTMAEIEYQVDELLFKMNALTGSPSLPEKQLCYYTDSDATYGVGDDGISSGGSEVRPFDEERFEKRIHQIEDNLYSHEPHLAQLIQLDCIGASKLSEDKEKQLWSALELEIFRQLQLQRQENKPSSEYHSNSSGSYGNSHGDPYSGNSSPCLPTVASNDPRTSNLGALTYPQSSPHSNSQDDNHESFMMTDMKQQSALSSGASLKTDWQGKMKGAGKYSPTTSRDNTEHPRKTACENVRTPSDASTSGGEVQGGVRPKLMKPRPITSVGEQSLTYTNYAYLCDSSSDSDAAKHKLKTDAKKTLRKTKSRGRGKGKHRLTEDDGLEDLGIDNEAFSSEDEGGPPQAWM